MPAVLFRGETIHTADTLPPWALVEFGAVASSEVQIASPQGMRTLFELFEVLVLPEDWEQFRKVARRASEGELVGFIEQVGAALKTAKTPELAQVEQKRAEASANMWE